MTRTRQYPPLGATVRMAHYAEGNVLRDSQSELTLTITGVVTETPSRGSVYLSVEPDADSVDAIRAAIKAVRTKAMDWGYIGAIGGTSSFLYDKHDTEAWSLALDRVTANRRIIDCEWTVEVIAPPAPPAPLVPQVGDLVRYAPDHDLDPDPSVDIWRERMQRDAVVVRVMPENRRADYALVSVYRPDEDPLPSERDFWYAPADRLRVVARANHTQTREA